MATEPAARDPRYDAAKRERAARLYTGGLTLRQVAAELGVSTRRAWELVKEGGATTRPAGRPPKEEP